MVMMYSTDTYPDGGPQPSSWADYLDKEKFPGIRGMIPQDWNWKHMVRWPLIADDPSLLETEEGRATLSAMTPEQLDKAGGLSRSSGSPLSTSSPPESTTASPSSTPGRLTSARGTTGPHTTASWRKSSTSRPAGSAGTMC